MAHQEDHGVHGLAGPHGCLQGRQPEVIEVVFESSLDHRAHQGHPERHCNDSIVTVSYDADGKRNVTGGSGLKATQAYPKPFGTAVGKAYARNMDTPIVANQQPFLHTTKTLVAQMKAIRTDRWADAELQEVLTYLSV